MLAASKLKRCRAEPEDDPDEEETAEEETDAPTTEDDDAELLAIDAQDVGEAFAETLARERPKIEHVRLRGDATARALLVDQLRDHVAKVTRVIDDLGGGE